MKDNLAEARRLRKNYRKQIEGLRKKHLAGDETAIKEILSRVNELNGKLYLLGYKTNDDGMLVELNQPEEYISDFVQKTSPIISTTFRKLFDNFFNEVKNLQ